MITGLDDSERIYEILLELHAATFTGKYSSMWFNPIRWEWKDFLNRRHEYESCSLTSAHKAQVKV